MIWRPGSSFLDSGERRLAFTLELADMMSVICLELRLPDELTFCYCEANSTTSIKSCKSPKELLALTFPG